MDTPHRCQHIQPNHKSKKHLIGQFMHKEQMGVLYKGVSMEVKSGVEDRWTPSYQFLNFLPIILSNRRGNIVYYYLGCTLIYHSLSYPFSSLVD